MNKEFADVAVPTFADAEELLLTSGRSGSQVTRKLRILACGRDWAVCEDLPIFWGRSRQLLQLV